MQHSQKALKALFVLALLSIFACGGSDSSELERPSDERIEQALIDHWSGETYACQNEEGETREVKSADIAWGDSWSYRTETTFPISVNFTLRCVREPNYRERVVEYELTHSPHRGWYLDDQVGTTIPLE